MSVCIYHSGCVDGLASAAIVKKAFGDEVVFHAGQYGSPPPEVEGKDVYIVDFSYKPGDLLKLLESANKLVLLDHHKTAKADLEHFTHPKADIIFDMTHSGAGLAWNYFFPSHPMPRIIAHVEDRDLWRFAMPGSKEVNHVLSCLPNDVNHWLQIFDWDVDKTIIEGAAIDQFFTSKIVQLKDLAFQAMIGGYVVPVCNAPSFFASELAGQLAEDKPFAGVFSTNGKEEFWSLRSRGDSGMDVSDIAKQYGGGGHKNASGFKAEAGKFFQQEAA